MDDPAAHADPDDQAPDRDSRTGTPRWVKAFGIVALALAVVFVVLQLIGIGGRHGPSRHGPANETGERSPPPGATETVHTGPPAGVTHP